LQGDLAVLDGSVAGRSILDVFEILLAEGADWLGVALCSCAVAHSFDFYEINNRIEK
jgi:hypothetical protein